MYLKRTLLISFIPPGKDVRVIYTPGSHCSTHSEGRTVGLEILSLLPFLTSDANPILLELLAEEGPFSYEPFESGS